MPRLGLCRLGADDTLSILLRLPLGITSIAFCLSIPSLIKDDEKVGKTKGTEVCSILLLRHWKIALTYRMAFWNKPPSPVPRPVGELHPALQADKASDYQRQLAESGKLSVGND